GAEGEPELAVALELPGKRIAERAASSLNAPRANEQAREVAVAVDPMLPAGEALGEGVGVFGGARDVRADAREGVGDLGAKRLDVAERERGGDERDELLIQAVAISVDEFHGVVRAPPDDIAAIAHLVESAADRELAC